MYLVSKPAHFHSAALFAFSIGTRCCRTEVGWLARLLRAMYGSINNKTEPYINLIFTSLNADVLTVFMMTINCWKEEKYIETCMQGSKGYLFQCPMHLKLGVYVLP